MASNLLQRVETALATYLQGKSAVTDLTTNIYAGRRGDDKSLPCVICAAESAGEDDPPATGNKWVEAQVSVHLPAPEDVDGVETLTDGNALSDAVTTALDDSGLAAGLTTGGTLTVQGVIWGGVTSGAEDGIWTTVISLKLYSMPS